MYTLYDLQAYVLDERDGYGDTTNERRALRAAIYGAEQVMKKHRWSDYHTEVVATVNAPVSYTSTVASDGTVTVSGGDPLPTWIDQASLVIDQVPIPVIRRLTDTTCLLETWSGGAKTSATRTFLHDRVPLTTEAREVYAVRNLFNDIDLTFEEAAAFRDHMLLQDGVAGDTLLLTSRSHSYYGYPITELRLSPAPSTAITLHIAYYRRPQRPTLVHDCGSTDISGTGVTISNAIAGSASVFNSRLLVSDNIRKPDPLLGFAISDDNPASYDLRVIAKPTATTLTLDASGPTVSDKGAILTHVLDLPEYTIDALQLYAIAGYMRVGEGSVGDYWQTTKMADEQLKLAMEQESTLSGQKRRLIGRTSTYTPATTSVAGTDG